MNEIKAIKAAPPKIIEVASKPSILEVAFPTIDRSHTELIATKPVQQVQAEQAQPEEEKSLEQLAAEAKELE